MFGNISQHYLTIFLLPPLLRVTSSAYMEVFLHQSILLTRLISLIESWKCQQKVLFVISFGLTLMTGVVGVYLQEVQDTLLVRILASNLTIQITLSSLQELINL